MRRTRNLAVAANFHQPPPVGEMRRHVTAEKDQPVLIEIFERARRAEALEIIRRTVNVEMHREQLALYQIRLRWLAQADGGVSFAYRQIELVVSGDERDVDIGIKIEEFAEKRREPGDN